MNTPSTPPLALSESTGEISPLGSSALLNGPSNKPAAPADEAYLREALKRCSPSTLESARAFRATGDYIHVPHIVTGVIERFVERSLREKLASPSADLRLIQDLGLDSLTMMEIVILTEEILPVTINNEELRHLRTLGDVTQFIECKLRGLPLPPTLTAQTCTTCSASSPLSSETSVSMPKLQPATSAAELPSIARVQA